MKTSRADIDASHNPDPLLTVAQVARYLEISENSVRRAIARRTLRAARIGGLIRVKRSAVETYIDAATID